MALVAETALDPTALVELEASLRGDLIRLEDPTYDDHRRIWNGRSTAGRR
jgi:hypothetical protein